MQSAPHLKGFIEIIAAEVARQIQAEERAARAAVREAKAQEPMIESKRTVSEESNSVAAA